MRAAILTRSFAAINRWWLVTKRTSRDARAFARCIGILAEQFSGA